MYLLYTRLHDLYTADGSAMHPTQEAIDAFAQEKGYVTVKLLYWPASGGENSQAQAEDFAARLSTAEDKDALYAEMAQQLGIEAGDTGRTFSAETLGETLSAAFSALEPGQVSDVIATDEGWYVAIGQTLDEGSVLDEMFTENVTQARSELTERACEGAIQTFALNLKPLLMQPPVKGHVTMGLDPGYAHGCKVAVIDATGKVLDTTVVYPTYGQRQKQEHICEYTAFWLVP